MPVQLLVRFSVKEELVETFIGIMSGAKADILAAPGCLGVEVLQGIDGASSVALLETWESKEIHDRYAAEMAAQGSMEKMAQFLTAEPRTEFYRIR